MEELRESETQQFKKDIWKYRSQLSDSDYKDLINYIARVEDNERIAKGFLSDNQAVESVIKNEFGIKGKQRVNYLKNEIDNEVIHHHTLDCSSLDEFRQRFPAYLDADSFVINL